MSARSHILDRLRTAIKGEEERAQALQTPAPVAANAIQHDRASLVSAFRQHAERSGAFVRSISTKEELHNTLREMSLTIPLMTTDVELLTECPNLAISASDTDDSCTLVRADAGIAETGTVCLHSGQVPSRSLFLCEQLLVLVREADILRYQEDYWRSHPETVPRAVHLITGPSRTADVEQTIQIGAHGPKTVTILLMT